MKYFLTLTLALLLSVCTIKAQETPNLTTFAHRGTVSVVVGEVYGPYVNDSVMIEISDNNDETINVTFCAYDLKQTAIGDLTLSEYTVSNIALHTEENENGDTELYYYRDYTNDGLSFHFTAVNDEGVTTFDSDYGFDKKGGSVTVKYAAGGGITVINRFQPGMMPFGIEATYSITVSSVEAIDAEQSAPTSIYDLQGRRQQHLRRGLNIVDGRKVLIK